MKALIVAVSWVLPWFLRRHLLRLLFGWRCHASARIGLAFIAPARLVMAAGSHIGHLTVCKGLALLELQEHASIGRGNWITGFPEGGDRHFRHQPDRRCELVVEQHAAITNRHLIDCTSSVRIGAFTTIAGFQSQILTHSIDLAANRQSSAPVVIGHHCFVGTNCVLLGGAVLPDCSVLGAKSLLNKAYTTSHRLYAGVPAREVKELPADLPYLTRTTGFVE